MIFANTMTQFGSALTERALVATRLQLDEVREHYDERLFRQLLGFSRMLSQYGDILEELNDPHFEINLTEFRGDL